MRDTPNAHLFLPNSFLWKTAQMCIVTDDLDATVKEYADRLGIGPWWIQDYQAPELHSTTLHGKPVEHSMRLALAYTGVFNWEVVQPLEGPSIYREFLNRKGPGLHHFGFMLDDLETDWPTLRATLAERDCIVVQEGGWREVNWVYFETPGPSHACFEIIERPASFVRPEPMRWYPGPPVAQR